MIGQMLEIPFGSLEGSSAVKLSQEAQNSDKMQIVRPETCECQKISVPLRLQSTAMINECPKGCEIEEYFYFDEMANCVKYKADKAAKFDVDVPERWLQFYASKDGVRAYYEGDGCNNEQLKGKTLLEVLLFDHTTGKNIVWGTTEYGHEASSEILPSQICGGKDTLLFSDFRDVLIRPRIKKREEEKKQRTKDKAEVFTPSWICNKQNNLVDEAWFDWDPKEHDGWSVFNKEEDKTWKVNPSLSIDRNTFTRYINDVRLEITCGEAPYLVCRYDTTTGKFFSNLDERIGLLDRKLRLINLYDENRSNWMRDVKKAYASCYGYEWQGDSLLLAREAMFYSFIEYYRAKWNEEPKINTLMQIAEIISWNLWQMDGLTFKVPYTETFALIKDWGKMHSDKTNLPPLTFESLTHKNEKHGK